MDRSFDSDSSRRLISVTAATCTPTRGCRRSGRRSAAAAAMAGETRCVRPPLPWRPSKLRLLVAAQRSPGSSLSGFIARHMLQPASRHSKPGVAEDRVEPFGLGLALDQSAAGHDHGADAVGHAMAAHHGRGGAQVLDPPVGAGADEHPVDRRST